MATTTKITQANALQHGLYEYGILQEQSAYRIHVCPQARRVYVYPTSEGVAAVKSGRYPSKPAFSSDGVVTALGVTVPPTALKSIREVEVEEWLWRFLNLTKADSSSEKGRKAEKMVAYLAEQGRLPLSMKVTRITDVDDQRDGVDAQMECKHRVQIKCDLRGGVGPGCHNTLYLQTHERNYHHEH